MKIVINLVLAKCILYCFEFADALKNRGTNRRTPPRKILPPQIPQWKIPARQTPPW